MNNPAALNGARHKDHVMAKATHCRWLDLLAVLGWIVSAIWPASANAVQVLPNSYAWGENVGWLNALPLGPGGPGLDVGANGVTGYMWGENVGWVSFSCTNTSSCGSVNYGVTRDVSGKLGGYAWGENIGWVSMSCDNTSSCASANYGVVLDSSSGLLTGFAWAENIGWISFSCAATCGAVAYGVQATAQAGTISKTFGASSIALNGSTTLSFTLTNPNVVATLTNVAFTDTLPAGLVVATPNGLVGTCAGGTINAAAGSGAISLNGATILPGASCTFSLNVTGAGAGVKTNSVTVLSTECGQGNTATATLTVVGPPSLNKAFEPATVVSGQVTVLTFTLVNPNAVALTGVAFVDTLPSGVRASSGSTNACGGTLTTTMTSIALSGATIGASSQCQFSVALLAGEPGQYTNTSGNVTSVNGGNGGTASASITVRIAAPIPMLDGRALALLATMLLIAALLAVRRRTV